MKLTKQDVLVIISELWELYDYKLISEDFQELPKIMDSLSFWIRVSELMKGGVTIEVVRTDTKK